MWCLPHHTFLGVHNITCHHDSLQSGSFSLTLAGQQQPVLVASGENINWKTKWNPVFVWPQLKHYSKMTDCKSNSCACVCVRACVCEYRLWDRRKPTRPHLSQPARRAIWWADEKLIVSQNISEVNLLAVIGTKIEFRVQHSLSGSVKAWIINSYLRQITSLAAVGLASSTSASYWSCRRSSSTSGCMSGSVSRANSLVSPVLFHDIAWQPPDLDPYTSTQRHHWSVL